MAIGRAALAATLLLLTACSPREAAATPAPTCFPPTDERPLPDRVLTREGWSFGYSPRLGGIGVSLTLNGLDVVEPRYAAGAAMQTAFGHSNGAEDGYRFWFLNQRAGNSRDPHWAYGDDQGWVPLWADQVLAPGTHTGLSPCDGTSTAWDEIAPAVWGAGPDWLTSEVTLRAMRDQAWGRWFAEAAFYMRTDTGGRITLRMRDGSTRTYALDSRAPDAVILGSELARVTLSWPGYGRIEVETPLGGWLAWDSGVPNVAWHTFLDGNMTEPSARSFRAGEGRTYRIRYRVLPEARESGPPPQQSPQPQPAQPDPARPGPVGGDAGPVSGPDEGGAGARGAVEGTPPSVAEPSPTPGESPEPWGVPTGPAGDEQQAL
jgi:hypothetical protein